MARRTKPIPIQVVNAFQRSNARFQSRLIDFDTDSSKLEVQHEVFLRRIMAAAIPNSAFHIRLFGFASKRGSVAHNSALALARMNSVVSLLQKLDQRSLSSIEAFQNLGNSESSGGVRDDSPEFRAVEIHLFIGEIPPELKDPKNTPVVVKPPAPLPGGQRFKQWSIAAPGGVSIAEGVGFGFNIFIIENKKLGEKRAYIQPVGGIGASLSLSGLKGAAMIIQQIATGVQGSEPEFQDVTASFPVTFDEIENCLVRVSSTAAGLIKGASFAIITMSGQVTHHGPSGLPIRTPEDIFQFVSAGEGFQLGAGASVMVGPLKRVD